MDEQRTPRRQRRIDISAHAIDRYRQRVDRLASRGTGRAVLTEMTLKGHLRSRPRHWMRHVEQTPGLRFLYWAELPQVCALVLDGVVVTVLTREVCRSSRHRRSEHDRPMRREARVARRHRLLELDTAA